MHRGVLAVAAVVALWTLPAFAQTATVAQDVFLTTQGDGQYLAKDLLLGAKVHNAEGVIVGDVEDLILNADNQVQGVIMGIGGFAGWGEKRVGVALSALQIKNENGIVTVTLPQATKETLEALPRLRAQDAAEVAARPRHREGEGALRQGLGDGEGRLRQGQAGAGEGLRGREDAGGPGAGKGARGDEGSLRGGQEGDGETCRRRDYCQRATPPATEPTPSGADDAARRGTNRRRLRPPSPDRHARHTAETKRAPQRCGALRFCGLAST